MGDRLVIDVVDPRTLAPGDGACVVVVVEPLYGCPAVALALDAGWGRVRVDALDGRDPIPLVSFEQSPPSDRASDEVRVRCDDLLAVAAHPRLSDSDDAATVLLGSAANARPLCAQLANRLAHGAAGAPLTVVFVPAISAPPAAETDDDRELLAADAWWACGMLVRVLLDELDGIDATLTDAAGMAVTLATGDDDPAAQLGTGLRWRRHLARGGSSDDLRVASAIDSCGAVPHLVDGGFVPWSPAEPLTPGAGPPADRT